MMDLTFLINKEEAIKLRDKVIDELESWNSTLSTMDENTYYKIINALTELIERLK